MTLALHRLPPVEGQHDRGRAQPADPAAFWVKRAIGGLDELGYGWRAACLYILLALPVVLVHAFLLAPSQVPDERNHFLRAVQLASGQLVAARMSPLASGGQLPASAAEALNPFDPLHFRADLKLDLGALRQARELKWNGPVSEVDFSNTAIYPPFFYAAVIAAIRTGQLLGMGVLDTFYFARFLNGLAAVTISGLAIGFAVRGRAFFVGLLLLPGTLGLYGSCSQDALLIAASALVAGLCSRALQDPQATRDRQRAVAAALLGAIVSARPPYVPLLAVLALRPLWPASLPSHGPWTRVRFLALAFAIVVAWIVFGAAPAKVPFLPGTASISGQISFLAEHPTAFFSTAYNTFERLSGLYFMQFVGVLGWLDAYFPRSYYATAGCVLVIAAAGELFAPGRGMTARERALVMASGVLATAALYITQYLSWSPVGSDWIDGVQGRYFLPIAVVLAAAVPRLEPGSDPERTEGLGTAIRAFTWVAIFVYACANLFVVPWVILGRYYA